MATRLSKAFVSKLAKKSGAQLTPARGNKYRAIRTAVDGHSFASKAEARRYGELRLLERAKKICQLRLQRNFPLIVNQHLVCTYRADFDYLEHQPRNAVLQWVPIVEDCKGVRTKEYIIKCKLMKAVYGIEIREV